MIYKTHIYIYIFQDGYLRRLYIFPQKYYYCSKHLLGCQSQLQRCTKIRFINLWCELLGKDGRLRTRMIHHLYILDMSRFWLLKNSSQRTRLCHMKQIQNKVLWALQTCHREVRQGFFLRLRAILLSQGSAVTKYHRVSDLNSRYLLLHGSEGSKA